MLWGLLNAIQIITHLPLYTIMFPGNAELLFKLIIYIAQFDIIPVEPIYDLFLQFD